MDFGDTESRAWSTETRAMRRHTAGSWSENKTANLGGGGCANLREQDDESKKALANWKQNCTVAPREREAGLSRNSWQLQNATSRRPLLSWQLCSLRLSSNCTLRKPRASHTGLHGGSGAAGFHHWRLAPENQPTGLLAFLICIPVLSVHFYVMVICLHIFPALFFFHFPLLENIGWQEAWDLCFSAPQELEMANVTWLYLYLSLSSQPSAKAACHPPPPWSPLSPLLCTFLSSTASLATHTHNLSYLEFSFLFLLLLLFLSLTQSNCYLSTHTNGTHSDSFLPRMLDA